MAKVQGPLMSFDASGTVAGVATFSKWKGRNYVRNRVTPANPQTVAQMAVRASMAGLVQLFQANVVVINTNFRTLADQRQISPFNAFTGYNQKQFSQARGPSRIIPGDDNLPDANPTSLSSAVDHGYVTLAWTPSVGVNDWALQIFRKLGSAPTGLNTELVASLPQATATWVDGPLLAGHYYYAMRAVYQGGSPSTLFVSTDIVVP